MYLSYICRIQLLMRSSLFFLLFLFISASCWGQVITIDRNLAYAGLGRSVSYLKDADGRLTIDQVAEAGKKPGFLKSAADILNFGNSSAAYWIKVSFVNKVKEKAYLVLDVSSIESIDYYTPDSLGGFSRFHTGSIAPGDRGNIQTNNYIFSLPECKYDSEIQVVYFRLKTNNILLVPLKIALPDRLVEGSGSAERFESVYIGILIALFFSNIFVFIRSKDMTYLYYSVYILFLFIYIVCYFRGYAYCLGDEFRIFINTYPHLFLGLGSLAGIAFSSSFLNLSVLLPRSKWIVRLLIVSWGVVILICLFGYKSYGSMLAQVLSSATTLVVWLLGVVLYWRGYKPALYYIVAWAITCLSTVLLGLSLSNFIIYSELYLKISLLGFVFELLLLSLALGDRLKDLNEGRLVIQSDKLRIQEENLYLIKTQNERLEEIVHTRTKVLLKTVKSLEEANADKSRLFSIIAHDLRSPFNSLLSLYSLNDLDLLSLEEVKMLLNDSRKSFDHIHNTLNNLLYWAQSQLEGISTVPSRFNVYNLVEELMMVYRPLILKKNIVAELTLTEDSDVFADLNQINLVVRNLLDNAIKFTPLNQFIHLKVWGRGGEIYVDVSNPVAGVLNIDQLVNNVGHKPSYGTSNERGVGLGLRLCKDFIERNNGKLMVLKEEGCVIFRFSLPKFKSTDIAAAD